MSRKTPGLEQRNLDDKDRTAPGPSGAAARYRDMSELFNAPNPIPRRCESKTTRALQHGKCLPHSLQNRIVSQLASGMIPNIGSCSKNYETATPGGFFGVLRLSDHKLAVACLVRAIRLENVSFSYPGTNRRALEEVSLELPAGSVVALVGENGAGKSTLVSCSVGCTSRTQVGSWSMKLI